MRRRPGRAWGCRGGQGCAGGGGAPHHRLLASPPGAELLTRRVLELGLCVPAGPHHRLLAPRRRRGERRDISPVAAPGGWLSRVRPQAGGGWFNWGLMSIHGPGRMGEGPNSRPRRFLLAVCGGGGYADFRFLGGEQPPVAKPRRPHRAGEPPQERRWGVGRRRWGVGRRRWGVVRRRWGVVRRRWGVGRRRWGVVRRRWGVGRRRWGVVRRRWGVVRRRWGVGRRRWGVGRRRWGVVRRRWGVVRRRWGVGRRRWGVGGVGGVW